MMKKCKMFDQLLNCFRFRSRCDPCPQENIPCCPCHPSGEVPCCPCCGHEEPQPVPVEDSFASFVTFEIQFTNGQPILLGTGTADSTGNITLENNTQVVLKSGYYQVSCSVSAILDKAGYMQITPSYNGASHLEYGIYFKTDTDASSACGSSFFIIAVPEQTNFTLTYNSDVENRSGAAMLTFLKLNREMEDISTV